MRLTVVGKSPAWEDVGGACSCYLVEGEDFRLLIDCGNGAFARLRARIDYTEIDAVLLTHLHADHFLDLVPFAYALTHGPAAGERPPPPLLCPPGSAETFRRIVGAWGSEELIESAFDLREYEPGSSHDLNGLRFNLHEVPHFALTHAVELIGSSGGRIVFGADCRINDELTAAARGADVLLAESTLAAPDPAPLSERGHMSAAEAGQLAADAGVGRLVLTHISDELDEAAAIEAASKAFDGSVEVAREGSSWAI